MTATVESTSAPTKTRSTAHRIRALLGNQAVGAILLAVLVAIVWEVFSDLTFVIPSPVQTIGVLIGNLSDPAYLFDLRVTAQSVFLAFVIGTAIGGGLGLLLGLSERLRVIFEPMLIMLNGIPRSCCIRCCCRSSA